MTLCKRYADSKAIGVFPMSNWGGLEVLDIVDKDGHVALVACFNWGTGRQHIRRHKVFYTQSGRDYIRKNGQRFYLDNIMRV